MRILIIDDDRALCRSLQIHLEREGHTVECAYSASTGIEALEAAPRDLVFVDLKLPDMSGLDVLRALKDLDAEPLSVMITGAQDAKATIEAVRLGAFDYIRKPLDLDAVMVTIEKAAQHFAKPTPNNVAAVAAFSDHPHEIVGAHPKTIEVLKQVGRYSQSRIPVLIQGESGTGKELVARLLHETGSQGLPFIAVNCSAVVPTLLESELFGHEKGAFTGADSTKTGKLEFAAEGTIFFDEIGDMSFDLQAKLLRTLQENEFERVGGTKPIPLKARVLAATNHDLESLIAEGKFREDLYYRLAVSVIKIPPLRERRSDIPLLAEHLLGRISKDLDVSVDAIEKSALRPLQAYDWPGNVRELRNVLMRAVVLARGPIITEDLIIESIERSSAQMSAVPAVVTTLREAEKRHIESALYAAGWNISRTASLLEISRVTLRKKIEDYDLKPPPGKRGRGPKS
jgi:two-component system response regulator AtoC